MTTHPIIDRLASLSSEELTVSDVVYVMGHSHRKIVDGLLASGELEAQQGGLHANRGKDPLGRPIRHRSVIAAAALLTYVVRITSGDKTVILDAISKRFPQHLALCNRVAGLAPLPSNVIPMHGPRLKRPAKDPYEGHPQLFTA